MKKRIVYLIDDDDDNKEDRSFMVNAITKPKSGMFDDIDVPIICLDDDDDDGGEDLENDKNYKVVLEESKSVDRVYQERKGKSIVIKSEFSRAITVADIQRDNRAAERRKRKLLHSETTQTSRSVPMSKTQQRDNRAGKCVELEAETVSRDVPMVRTEEEIELDNGDVELEAARTSKVVPLVRTQEDTEKDNEDSEQRKLRTVKLEAARNSRVVPLVRAEKDIERDNGAAKQRKLRIVDLEAAGTSNVVPLVRTEENIERDKGAAEKRKLRVVELEAAGTSRVVPFVRTEKNIERDNGDSERRKLRIVEVEATGTSSIVPLVRTENDIERDNGAAEKRKLRIVDLEAAGTSRVVRTEKNIERDNGDSEQRKLRINEVEATGTSSVVPLVRTEKNIERDNGDSAQRKLRIVEVEATGTSSVRTEEQRERRVVGIETGRTTRTVYSLRAQQEDDRAETETLSRAIPLVRIQKDSEGGNRAAEICTVAHVERVNRRSTMDVDYNYVIYVKWLVDSMNKRMVNAVKESTTVLDEDQLVEVKVEEEVESFSDDSDIIAISDSPFTDVEDTMFVSSKKVVDLDGGSKEVEGSNRCLFRKELMDVLNKPYNEEELKELHHDVSIHRRITRSRELRMGRVTDYQTDELGQSYLEKFRDFENEYKAVGRDDKVRALKLLRGFFFYLTNVSHDGAFKPWVENQWSWFN